MKTQYQKMRDRLKWIGLLKKKKWWTAEDAANYLGRSVFYVNAQFRLGHLKRNRENLTCEKWVEEYLKNPIRGMYRSNLRK